MPSARRYGCTVGCEEILLVRSLPPGTCFRGTTQRSEPVSTKNLMLLNRSVMKRRRVIVEQASAAINTCRCRFPAAGRSTVVYTYVRCLQIACCTGNNRELLGCGPGKERHYPCVCLWSENGVGCGHWIGLPIGETGPQSSVADWRCLVLWRWMQWLEAEQLRRYGQPVERQCPGCLRPGLPVWFGCEAATCWTRCFSGSRPARPVPGSSGGAGIGTIYGPPSLRASGAGERVDHEMMTSGVLARC